MLTKLIEDYWNMDGDRSVRCMGETRKKTKNFSSIGAACRRDTSASSTSIIEEAFADWLADASWLHTVVDGVQERFWGTWADVCGFLESLDSNERWEVREHGALPILHEARSIRQTDHSCHHEEWLQMDFVEQRNSQAHHERHERWLFLKERPTPNHHSKPKYQTGKHTSDHSLSSLIMRPLTTKNRRCFQRSRHTPFRPFRRTPSAHEGHQQLTFWDANAYVPCRVFLVSCMTCLILSRARACHFHTTRPINVSHQKIGTIWGYVNLINSKPY